MAFHGVCDNCRNLRLVEVMEITDSRGIRRRRYLCMNCRRG